MQCTLEENKINRFLFFTPHWVSLNWNIIEHFRPEKLLIKFVFKCKIFNDIFYFYFIFLSLVFMMDFYFLTLFINFLLLILLYLYCTLILLLIIQPIYVSIYTVHTYTLLLMSLNQLSFLRYLYPFLSYVQNKFKFVYFIDN